MKLIGVCGILFPFLIWLTAVDLLQLAPATLIPNFLDTGRFILDALASGEIFENGFATAYRWVYGFAIGVALGAPLGVILGQFKVLRNFFTGTIEYFRSIPVTALIPLFLALFGVGDFSRIAMVILPTFLLMTITMQAAVLHISPARCEMARSFKASEAQIFRLILIPEIMPAFFTGIRLSVSLSLVVVIVSEMFVGARNGIGQRIYESYMTSQLESLFGYLLLLGLIGLSLNILTEEIEQGALQSRSCDDRS